METNTEAKVSQLVRNDGGDELRAVYENHMVCPLICAILHALLLNYPYPCPCFARAAINTIDCG